MCVYVWVFSQTAGHKFANLMHSMYHVNRPMFFHVSLMLSLKQDSSFRT